MRKSFALSFVTLLIPGLLFAQYKVSGTVTDAKTGDKLVGANVIVEGTETGTSTNVDGNYTLTIPAGLSSAKVTARYIGFKQASVIVTASGTQDFSLAEDVLKMDAVMVTGVAGALTKTKTPFAIDKIDADVLEMAPSTTVESMIRGKSAGVKVVKASGEPGYAASVQLRGATSINSSGRSQAPLYIIDGIIIDPSVSGSPMGDISPDDVQSIEIVKGASGASEYGARAANGVIAITTKRGSEIGMGQTRFNYKMEQGYNQLNGSIETNGVSVPKFQGFVTTGAGSRWDSSVDGQPRGKHDLCFDRRIAPGVQGLAAKDRSDGHAVACAAHNTLLWKIFTRSVVVIACGGHGGQRLVHSVRRTFGSDYGPADVDAVTISRQRPSLQTDHRDSVAKGMPNLRQGPKGPADGDNRLSGMYHDHIPGVPHAGDDRYVHVAICFCGGPARQDSDGGPALRLGPPADGFHDSAQSAANDHDVPSGQFPADLFCQFHVFPCCGIAAADY